MIDSLLTSLLSPMVLAFALGIVAALVRSDLKVPDALSATLSIYLLLAIGLKGGAKLEGISVAEFLRPLAGALGLCVVIPVVCFIVLRKLGRFATVDAAAVAAHYGSVSVVTFSACLGYLDGLKIDYEPYLPALLAIMEVPAIVIAIFLARRGSQPEAVPSSGRAEIFHELLTGKGTLLLVGGLAIGLACGKDGHAQIAPLFDAPFRGVLTLFLLDVGVVTGRRLFELRKTGAFLAGFGIVMPLLHGLLGTLVGHWCGLGTGGATVLGTLAASASYIAAPAAVRVALPQANPALYLTAPLAITFPFNVVLGIPIYHACAKFLGS